MARILRSARGVLIALVVFGTVAAVFAATARAGSYSQIRFAPGTNAATVDGAVVRGDLDVYLVEARAGQTVTVSVESVEDNAVINFATGNGYLLLEEQRWGQVVLPADDNYSLVVMPTRGNATYSVHIRID